MNATAKNGSKPADLPRILVVLGIQDFGPSDFGQSAATCPHCGAHGRYVMNFLCDDGTKRGAMRECFKLFRGAESRVSKLLADAYRRKSGAEASGKKLASWWMDMIREAELFGQSCSVEAYPAFAARIYDIDDRRQAWLRRNGYARTRRH